MRIIKLNAIDSTNSFLRQLSVEEGVTDYTVVVTNYQTHGRGQMGTEWNSKDSKNLMFSVFKDVSSIHLEHHFYISMVVSLSILKALQELQILKLSIKWPNDILSDHKKLAGILIENVIKQNQLQGSIIGIGLNVNQIEFKNLPNATSLQLVSGNIFELDEVLQIVLKQLKIHFDLLEKGQLSVLKNKYEAKLFRKNKPSTFRDAEGRLFSGFIIGVTNSGHLQVKLEDDVIQKFDLKTITLLY